VNFIFQFVLKHGYSVLFAATLAHQIGFPIPGPLFLVAAGALAANGKVDILTAIGTAVIACVLADWVWYEMGRRGGEKVLHSIHRFTRDPEFHDRNAKRIFARYGLPLLLVAKFVPGFDAVAPPLAGISRTSRAKFAIFDAAGASLYVCAYGSLGYLFSNNLNRAAAYVSKAGTLLLCIAITAACIYIAYYKLIQQFHIVRKPQPVQAALADPANFGTTAVLHRGVIEGNEDGD
jgi:membrane protein DedA with SNARE-associated domain